MEDGSGDLDATYTDPTPNDYEGPLLWYTYQVYTEKFSIGVFDEPGTADGSMTSNAKGYGMLSSVWLGFNAKDVPIYVLSDCTT